MKIINLKISLLAASFLAVISTDAVASVAVDFASTTGYGVSANRVMIQNIGIQQTVTNPFDPTHPTITTTPFDVQFDFDLPTLHLIPSGAQQVTPATQCASLTVYVTNAATGAAIPSAIVTAGSTNVTADTTGTATLSGLVAGSASLTATAANFTSASRQVTLSCATANSVGIALTPTTGNGAITASEARITLTWGADPRDLDSHLTSPSSTSNGSTTDTTNRDHTFYASRTHDVAVLDVDDTTSYGPETITIFPPSGLLSPIGSGSLRPGLYRYSVHHYSGNASIATSNASVVLTLGSLHQEFLPPAGGTGSSGDIWTVFELVISSTGAATVYPINTYSTGGSSSSVYTTSTGYGDIERGVDFGRLPAKP